VNLWKRAYRNAVRNTSPKRPYMLSNDLSSCAGLAGGRTGTFLNLFKRCSSLGPIGLPTCLHHPVFYEARNSFRAFSLSGSPFKPWQIKPRGRDQRSRYRWHLRLVTLFYEGPNRPRHASLQFFAPSNPVAPLSVFYLISCRSVGWSRRDCTSHNLDQGRALYTRLQYETLYGVSGYLRTSPRQRRSP
jgi:hypothetical protein